MARQFGVEQEIPPKRQQRIAIPPDDPGPHLATSVAQGIEHRPQRREGRLVGHRHLDHELGHAGEAVEKLDPLDTDPRRFLARAAIEFDGDERAVALLGRLLQIGRDRIVEARRQELPRRIGELRHHRYHAYADISVAVSAPNGLVVPVIRDAQDLTVAGIEKTIGDFGKRAKDGTLKMEEMKGGPFTISNGGVFGSLMSTPIINPPQSAVLGLHRIEERPVVVDGQIVIRPMMYLALSYDHRIIDGREAVTFLVALKNAIQDPTRILIDL